MPEATGQSRVIRQLKHKPRELLRGQRLMLELWWRPSSILLYYLCAYGVYVCVGGCVHLGIVHTSMYTCDVRRGNAWNLHQHVLWRGLSPKLELTDEVRQADQWSHRDLFVSASQHRDLKRASLRLAFDLGFRDQGQFLTLVKQAL